MTRHSLLRPLPARSVDPAALRRRALAARAHCRRHGIDHPINVLRGGVVIAAGCPVCYPQFARANGAKRA